MVAILLSPVFGGTFSGSLKTKQGVALANFPLRAVRQGDGENVSLQTDRFGSFSAELADGSWTVTADEAKRLVMGLAPLDNTTVTMGGGAPVTRDLVLLATRPLRTPNLKFARSASGALSFNVSGQAGTVVTIYSSTDLVNWSTYYSRSIVTGFSYSVGNPPGNFPHRYFKAVASD